MRTWLSILRSQLNLQAAANVTGSAHIGCLLVSFAIRKHHTSVIDGGECASRRVLQEVLALCGAFLLRNKINCLQHCMYASVQHSIYADGASD